MDGAFFKSRVWPHMFYMSPSNLWKWKMNVARAMGNILDDSYVPDLIRAYGENDDDRLRGMIAWALGRIGGSKAKGALERLPAGGNGVVREEIEAALAVCRAVRGTA
jgi:epoxyqueuosine reductase